jgi:spore coat polysaccharide biosynthesis predicted glycosyltransferase SpsG
MIILLWAEGGNNIGSGHLNRVIDIYNVLKGEYNVEFYASEEDSIEFYKKTGINLTDIKNLHKNDYILVSDLRYPEKYSEILYYLSKNSYKHISINDMGLAQRDADIIIDGHIKNFEEYKKNPLTEYYLGTDYFILKTRFRHFNKVRRKIRKKANKIYLTLGGWSRVEDLRYITELLLIKGFKITLSWGFGKTNRERRLFRKTYPSVKIVMDKRYISRKYYEADITIAAGGISYYEAASTGSPIIMFYKDDYQKFIVESLMEKGYGISAGKLSNFDENNFLKLLTEYKYDFDSRNKHSIIGKQLVDGLGIYRLKKIIEKL